MKNLFRILSVIFLAGLISCNTNTDNNGIAEEVKVTTTDTVTTLDSLPEENVEQTSISTDSNLTLLSKEVLLVLKNKDYTAFAKYIHPEDGCLFSPYGYIDTVAARVISQANFVNLLNDGKKLNWGNYDGSGDAIELSLKQYFEKFVYNADFLYPEKFAINKMLGSGNSLNNLTKIFPNLNFTESYFPGFKKEYSGMDWTTLRLVFKKLGDKFYLRAVVHDQWTS